ncbi:MAG: biliverdin-producing heme oxygenase [Chitinophagaceae bacterium]|nr:biliverdin-producing heme oxygenase [Chitinophagaceae bacterium]
MVAAQLKEKTKQAHISLEKKMVGYIKKVESPKDYEKLLRLFYGYYTPLEPLLNKYISNDIVPSYSDRRKSNAILKDINTISAGASNFKKCDNLPQVNDVIQALGVLYVMEGSTMGGTIIAKMLNKQANIQPTSLTFFNGYGEQNIPMWQSFIKAVNKRAANDGDKIVKAANDTFSKMEEWCDKFYEEPVTKA